MRHPAETSVCRSNNSVSSDHALDSEGTYSVCLVEGSIAKDSVASESAVATTAGNKLGNGNTEQAYYSPCEQSSRISRHRNQQRIEDGKKESRQWESTAIALNGRCSRERVQSFLSSLGANTLDSEIGQRDCTARGRRIGNPASLRRWAEFTPTPADEQRILSE